ncbi:MAG: hypothetical protein HYX34_11155 [Actinobacteria bacterium]|nr:hypothetical protein [Actinomycetota bacterium]
MSSAHRPYLRPTVDPPAELPDGWATDPAGRIDDQLHEVVHPANHTVLVAVNGLSDTVRAGLRATGWNRLQATDLGEVWTIDHTARARTRLTGASAANPAMEGPAREGP